MRLIDSRTLEFKEFPRGDSVPKYAILSHTWTDNEVIFKDMQDCGAKLQSEARFAKIEMCAKQALKDNFDHF
jgi:hypothetical protein